MTETLREAVARAISEARALPGTKPFWTSDVDRRAADAAIRTVLERLRRPSFVVKAAGAKVTGNYDIAHEVWAQMLDAAAREVIRKTAPSGPST